MTERLSKGEALREWSEKKRAAGLCVRCGKKAPAPGHEYCSSCSEKQRQSRRGLWADRQSRGLCPSCGGRRSDDHFIVCGGCRARQIESKDRTIPIKKRRHYGRKWARKHKRERTRDGLCTRCGGAGKLIGGHWCGKCREKGRAYYYANRDKRLAAMIIRRRRRFVPKPLCGVCGRHRNKCACGKVMKPTHGEDSCRYTCTCGNVTYFLRNGGDHEKPGEPAPFPRGRALGGGREATGGRSRVPDVDVVHGEGSKHRLPESR